MRSPTRRRRKQAAFLFVIGNNNDEVTSGGETDFFQVSLLCLRLPKESVYGKRPSLWKHVMMWFGGALHQPPHDNKRHHLRPKIYKPTFCENKTKASLPPFFNVV
ncbi:UNVERIFIED_CONTAM: hypothetical protein RMT77_019634 [Armadillidium vulgare]